MTAAEIRREAYALAVDILASHWDGADLRQDFDPNDDDAIREYLKDKIIPALMQKTKP